MNNVAVIGWGYWGKNLVRNTHALEALTAVTDSTIPEIGAQGRALMSGRQLNVSLYDGSFLDDDVFCEPNCVFANITDARSQFVRRNQYTTTVIRRGQPWVPTVRLRAASPRVAMAVDCFIAMRKEISYAPRAAGDMPNSKRASCTI